MHLAFSVHYEDKKNVFAFKMGGTLTLFRVHFKCFFFFLKLIFSHLAFVLDLYQCWFLGDILNLERWANFLWKLVRITHQFHLQLEPELGTTWLRAQALMKDGLSVNLQSSPTVKRASHPSLDRIRPSPLHHMTWRQPCCCCVGSLLSLSSTLSPFIRALSLNLGKSNNWKRLELCLVSSRF